jgi:hypothetical protein
VDNRPINTQLPKTSTDYPFAKQTQTCVALKFWDFRLVKIAPFSFIQFSPNCRPLQSAILTYKSSPSSWIATPCRIPETKAFLRRMDCDPSLSISDLP